MVRKPILWTILGLWAAATASGAEWGRRGASLSTEVGPIEDCRQLRVRFEGAEGARAEETRSVPAPRGALRMRAPSSSGVFVHGSDRSDVSITACKAAAAAEDLDRIAISFEDGELRARGPEGRDWIVHFIVRAPRGAGLDLEASNGPVSVRGISGAVVARAENGPLAFEDSTGRIQAETKNGPISLKDCSGTVQANAVNGPVSVAGSGGDTNVSTQNGPISVRLSGSHWDGKLDARARNGPLSLSLPDGFASGVLVESSGRSPLQCRAAACAQANESRREDESRWIAFGDPASAAVRLSTVNGPVSIRSDPSREE